MSILGHQALQLDQRVHVTDVVGWGEALWGAIRDVMTDHADGSLAVLFEQFGNDDQFLPVRGV